MNEGENKGQMFSNNILSDTTLWDEEMQHPSNNVTDVYGNEDGACGTCPFCLHLCDPCGFDT